MYDYRTRRISLNEAGTHTGVVYSGGLSSAEYQISSPSQTTGGTLKVRYQRGPDMGGGVGGLLYTLRGTDLKYGFNNGRGDIVAQHDSGGNLTWSASYEAFGKRPVENGTNADRQRANSKDEDPTGLLNEGFRYRDLETGVWLSRDPAGFVDGPNLYAYVRQNPWTAFDPDGLRAERLPDGSYMFISNEVPSYYIGLQVIHPHPGYTGQCATGAQYACGTIKIVGKNEKLYDAPSTTQNPKGGGPWRKGPSLKDYQPPPGTMIAWGFDDNGKYPSTPSGNHTALYEGPTEKMGEFTAISQNRRTKAGKSPSPFSRDFEYLNSYDWYVVVADSPHDPRASESSLVRASEGGDYQHLDDPNINSQAAKAIKTPTESAKNGFFKRLKEVFSRKKKVK